ncbi:MAG TPA: zinc-binding alcohol dehydrogenase family protein [Acidobacteriaceae bacterium]|jgi:threonine dehydrogenase-like Zn-dependent dehydrogenase|nr:zinc-binding alcohol dehydrogenase family protein [Acidobacteriaceae bacterium]
MKAVVLHRPGAASVEERPEPVVRPGDALLRVRRVGLCGSDLNSWRGRNPLVSYPRIPGHEVAATIVDLTRNDTQFATGMDVTLSPYSACHACAACRAGRPNACQHNETLGVQRDGALAEFIAVPIEKLYRADLTLDELALVEPLTVGFHAVARAGVQPSDSIAILGCGGVGLGAVAGAVFRGATVIAVDVEDTQLEIARRIGASHTVNSQHQDLATALKDLTGGTGPSGVIEAIGVPETYRAAVELVAFAGRVVYIGYASEPVAYQTKLFVQKELDICGSRNALPEDFADVIRMLEQHRFPADLVIRTSVRLEEVPAILPRWSESPGIYAKIMTYLD